MSGSRGLIGGTSSRVEVSFGYERVNTRSDRNGHLLYGLTYDARAPGREHICPV